MDKRTLLNAYRVAVMELNELECQLSRTGTDGRPAPYRGIALDREARGTNEPAAAVCQLADGLAEMAKRKRDELAQMSGAIFAVLNEISDWRTMTVIQHYYLMAETDEMIARLLVLSTSRVNQIRRRFLAE